jgi:2-keto-4-pentenoate hydratase/2-oxohepta-3-ene-1,7-dioic acid hydratase in catechol pathway
MKIICVGRNYVKHIEELGNAVPEEPVIFMKPKSALQTPKANFWYPSFSNELHYEAELVLRVCKNGKNISKKLAHHYIDKITVGIDFTARDVQQYLKEKGLPWEKAKAWDNSAAIGDWRDFSKYKNPIHFQLFMNNELVQDGNSTHMMYDFATIISHVSEYFSLNIGDLIFTGTPAGVGECVIGDVLTGILENEKVLELEIK